MRPVLLATAGHAKAVLPQQRLPDSCTTNQPAQQEERGPDQVQPCACISAELARAHGREHVPALRSVLAEGGQTYLIWHKVISVWREDIEHGIKLKWGGWTISDLAEEAAGTKLACQNH